MSKVSRYKLRRSDRSGFRYYENEMIRQNGSWIGPDEYDEPPPSNKSLGGEGDVNRDGIRTSTALTIEASRVNPTFYITAAGGISPNLNHPYMRISGSNGAIDISANPQIGSGKQNDVLTIFGVDSRVTLDEGTGLALANSQSFNVDSGSIITFIYNTGGSVWTEVDRTARGGFGG